jgi:hypothetical protein
MDRGVGCVLQGTAGVIPHAHIDSETDNTDEHGKGKARNDGDGPTLVLPYCGN